ncbi:MAG TPA: hypothetical protein VGG28_35060 [Kofleriaceae bacterium]|jgi:hypothetical protein
MRRRDPDHYEPRPKPKARARDDRPKFGPPRPDQDRGMRGGTATGQAGAFGPRSDMMEYGGFEQAAYDRHRNYYEGYQSSENPDPPKTDDGGKVDDEIDDERTERYAFYPRFVSHMQPPKR